MNNSKAPLRKTKQGDNIYMDQTENASILSNEVDLVDSKEDSIHIYKSSFEKPIQDTNFQPIVGGTEVKNRYDPEAQYTDIKKKS